MYDKSPSGQWSQNLAPSSMPKRLRPSFRSSPFLSAVETIVSMLSEALLSFGDISATFGLILQKGSRHTSHQYATSNALSPICSPALRNVLGQRNHHL